MSIPLSIKDSTPFLFWNIPCPSSLPQSKIGLQGLLLPLVGFYWIALTLHSFLNAFLLVKGCVLPLFPPLLKKQIFALTYCHLSLTPLGK